MCFLSGLSRLVNLKNYNYTGLGGLSNLFGGVTSVHLLYWPELCRLNGSSAFNHSGRQEVVYVASCSVCLKFFTVPSCGTTGFFLFTIITRHSVPVLLQIRKWFTNLEVLDTRPFAETSTKTPLTEQRDGKKRKQRDLDIEGL